jgi:ribosomal protein L35
MKTKTVKSAKKRIVKISASGKILRRTLSAQHRTSGKSKRVLRGSNKNVEVSGADRKKLRKLILQ